MKHRIVVLGAGYAGAHAAGRLARRLHPGDTRVTLVNADPDFVERIRLHQLAAGQDLPYRPLRDIFAGTPVELLPAWVTGIDAERRTVVLGDREIPYETLVVALGSSTRAEPGRHHVSSRAAALRLRERLSELGPGETVLVVGGGLTAIEASTEIAESRPDLRVRITARRGVGTWLSDKAQQHLQATLSRLSITEVAEQQDAAVTVWTTGFSATPIAAGSGLTVSDVGRIVVDGSMRSVSHPSVYAVGDAASAEGPDGRPMRMCCASAVPMAWRAADAIAERLTGRLAKELPLRYYGQCISLGRRDGILQITTADDEPTSTVVTGRRAARIKEWVCSGAAWNIAYPTMMLPSRRRHIRSAPGAPAGTTGRTGETAGNLR
ncbi:NAD(P)/FAD-dependent oxidoreductase [Paractinoplanes hotanensis]|uniref:FAD-dependent oxidoreductase n=1 Tax=Paractinoplanes hotanensis TaxID=2906497 RepID=A0ABT0Y2K0_9ACTN|nr:FAD-dependent oxidoreductase [Actinoplanes hotanensis]MCM4080258.1 FAD-dependent oxidoreductase [Actinoplanes hotanensis]